MKPIVIYIDKNSSKITLTKEEFEKHLKEAYDNGYSDGQIAANKSWYEPVTIPTIDMPIRYGTTTPDVPNPYQITCEAHNATGD